MNILVLGMTGSPLTPFLKRGGNSVKEWTTPLPSGFLRDCRFDFIVSYRYRHLVRQDVLDAFRGRIVNLHISLLPWNRGADPNLWSFLEDTPKGVTVHFMDDGLDTGPIVTQKAMAFDESRETLASTYLVLNQAVIDLFRESWGNLSGGMEGELQPGGGSFHRLKDKEPYLHLLEPLGWDTPVRDLKGKALTFDGGARSS